MKFKGFEQADFDVFSTDTLEGRMEALKTQLRPKFYDLGEDLEIELSKIVGYKMKTHVAKHARRKTNPPNDSWFAIADANYRGYKMLPHFQVAVWQNNVLIQWGMIYEAESKKIFGEQLINNIDKLRKMIPGEYCLYKDHMKPEGENLSELSDEEIKIYAKRLMENKNGELMIAKVLTSEEAINMKPENFEKLVLETWKNLNFLHKMAEKKD